jgi:putative isomerase
VEVDMNFDRQFQDGVVPFSRYGSYIAFSHLPGSEARPEGLYMRSLHGHAPSPQPHGELFRVQLVREGQPVPFKEAATPAVLRLEAEGGHVEICIPEPRQVRVRAAGVGVRLTSDTAMFDNAIPRPGDRWQVTSHALQVNTMLTPIRGRLAVDAPWRAVKSDTIVVDLLPDPDTGIGECAVEEFGPTWQERDDSEGAVAFDDCLGAVAEEYRAFVEGMPTVPAAYAEARELAAYVNWSSVVAPEGYLSRPAMLMSKNWMTSVWSWDNCFNAMALVYGHPQLAWDQFMIPIDSQDASGVFPDSINDRLVHWSFRKPPIQGWALRWMMERTDFITKDRLEEVYEPLCRWTQWWFDHRDDDRDAISQYNHGNDSGWDNSTVFAIRPPIESPDLPAYLATQMDVLAEVARILGETRQAGVWESRSNILVDLLRSHSWRGDRFVALRSGDHEVSESDSLLLFMPIILGKRLRERVRSSLVAGLKEEGRFLTEHGLASESLRSPLYESDGYWRGPIWAPSTLIAVEGLAAAGETQFARELARRFCDMAAHSGMAENYDAVTGAGLRDRAYTWTASVFLILAHEYLTGRS